MKNDMGSYKLPTFMYFRHKIIPQLSLYFVTATRILPALRETPSKMSRGSSGRYRNFALRDLQALIKFCSLYDPAVLKMSKRDVALHNNSLLRFAQGGVMTSLMMGG